MDDNDALANKLCSVAHISKEEATHLLEAFGWNYEEAVRAHFDDDADHGLDHDEELANEEPSIIPANTTGNNAPNYVENKITTLDSIRAQSPDNSDGEGQAFYVGGSERGGGGQQVLGPPKKKEGRQPNPNEAPDEFIHDLFKAAEGQGAEVLDTDRYNRELDPRHQTYRPFAGAGYQLGEDANAPSPVIQPSGGASGSGPSARPGADKNGTEKEKPVIVKMWRDGFSLDDGPLRAYANPESAAFLEDIKNGRVPEELIRSASGGLVNVLMEDHHHETWKVPPPPKVVPFAGKGNILGHPVPPLTSNPSSKHPSQTDLKPVSGPEIDEAKPLTQLQIRLPDGGRLVVRLNHSHTVSDIRQAIMSQRSSLVSCPFVLLTAFPNRLLEDEKQSLIDAKLLNSALMIRFT